jgi:hypothetical protein
MVGGLTSRKDVGYLVATGREVMTSIVYGWGSRKAKSRFG